MEKLIGERDLIILKSAKRKAKAILAKGKQKVWKRLTYIHWSRSQIVESWNEINH